MKMTYIVQVLTITLMFVIKSIQFQPFTAKNHILPHGKTFRSISTDWFGCVESCFQDFKCSSYNFWFLNEKKETENGLCELNRCGAAKRCEDDRSSLVFQNGAIFQQIRDSQVWHGERYSL